jgi:hypothetical protein
MNIEPHTELIALQNRIALLEHALDELVKLQAHYASLLNQYDGGERMQFASRHAWLDRLEHLRSQESRLQ